VEANRSDGSKATGCNYRLLAPDADHETKHQGVLNEHKSVVRVNRTHIFALVIGVYDSFKALFNAAQPRKTVKGRHFCKRATFVEAERPSHFTPVGPQVMPLNGGALWAVSAKGQRGWAIQSNGMRRPWPGWHPLSRLRFNPFQSIQLVIELILFDGDPRNH
jgi:hypothetical protein